MEYIHKELAAGKWFTYTFDEQMGNIGSETYRMLNAGDDCKRFEGAFRRGLELLDLTISDPRWHGRMEELMQVREKLVRAGEGKKEYHGTLEELDQYLFKFAWVARAER